MARRAIEADTIGKAIAMHRSGMSKQKVAATLGVSRDSVKRWTAGDVEPRKADAVERVDADVTQRIRGNLDTFLVKATDVMATDQFVMLSAVKPKDMTIEVGIAIEKRELLSGRATSRSESLKIELVAGGSLKELAERTMSVRLPLPRRADIVHSTIDGTHVEESAITTVRMTPE